MNDVVSDLEACLQNLDAIAAANFEKAAQKVIAGASLTIGDLWSPEFMAELRRLWGDAPFERPPQPIHEDSV